MDLNDIKNRFGIIGHDPRLEAALNTARQIAGTDLSVLITGESGVGKEVIPKMIHSLSPRKHKNYVAINCGAIPDGTIESELFGHEKGSFTGANEARKGYFEEANGGTIFLDEVGELPLSTQVRLLRVLETGEFLRVGSSKVQKTDVRVIAASNINFMHAINVGKFREDLYYRLNAVPIYIPPLRERKKDIHLLFKKFALDIADKYSMPAVKLDPQAQSLLESYRWTGNVRQLKNVAEQISVLENDRQITAEILQKYLPAEGPDILPVLAGETNNIGGETYSDRDLIFKILLQMNQMRQELDALKANIASGNISAAVEPSVERPVQTLPVHINKQFDYSITDAVTEDIEDNVNVEEPKTLSIHDANTELILRALEKHHNNRKAAAEELGISERTLYRRLNDLNKTKK